jgi:hypothetical protein
MRKAALDIGDVDGDGDTDYFDARAMADKVGDLLAAIQRGDFVSAVEKSKGAAVAAAYFKQLDGLGFDEVVELADAADDQRYVAQLKRQAACAPKQGWRDERPPPGGYTSRIRTCD